MQFRVPVVTLFLILAIAACGKRDPVEKGANAVTAVPGPVNAATPTPDGAPPGNDTQSRPAATPLSGAAIPTALQGRWGLTPADCASRLDQAKGLLTINAGELRFYESRAVPSPAVQMDGGSITGNFQFRGEGEAWNRFESLKQSGDTLIRTETNPAASYTYAKC